MYSHEQIWNGIELLAKNGNMSVSALAKGAGLDATAFNKSKRHSWNGQPRWISMGTLSKILTITDTKFSDFAVMIESNGRE